MLPLNLLLYTYYHIYKKAFLSKPPFLNERKCFLLYNEIKGNCPTLIITKGFSLREKLIFLSFRKNKERIHFNDLLA